MKKLELNQPQRTWQTEINRIPLPVLIFSGLVLLLAGIKSFSHLGADNPNAVAKAVGEGLMSVFHDDKSLKNLTLIFTKNGVNRDGTVELHNFGAGLGGLFSGQMRAGGELYFKNYYYSPSIILSGGPLDIDVSNATDQSNKAARYRIKGSLRIRGSDQPVTLKIEFISHGEAYDVTSVTGEVQMNGKLIDL